MIKQFIAEDSSDTEALIESIKKALKKFGVIVHNVSEDDTIALIFSDYQMNKSQKTSYLKEIGYIE